MNVHRFRWSFKRRRGPLLRSCPNPAMMAWKRRPVCAVELNLESDQGFLHPRRQFEAITLPGAKGSRAAELALGKGQPARSRDRRLGSPSNLNQHSGSLEVTPRRPRCSSPSSYSMETKSLSADRRVTTHEHSRILIADRPSAFAAGHRQPDRRRTSVSSGRARRADSSSRAFATKGSSPGTSSSWARADLTIGPMPQERERRHSSARAMCSCDR